jgi:tetratricopeptide (TPR) repeat protein
LPRYPPLVGPVLPDHFTHLYLGNWYFADRDYAAALERFEYATELPPDDPVSYWCRADVHARLGDTARADELYRRAVEVSPRDRQARRKLREWERERRARRDEVPPGYPPS